MAGCADANDREVQCEVEEEVAVNTVTQVNVYIYLGGRMLFIRLQRGLAKAKQQCG